MREALASGTAAYEAKQYSKAASGLGRYLMVNRRDIPVLLKYADSQLRCRPQSKGWAQQAVNALEAILRTDPGHRELPSVSPTSIGPWAHLSKRSASPERG